VSFDVRRQDIFLEAYRTSSSHPSAARAAGVTRKTVYDQMSRNPEFKARVLEARKEIEAMLADELIRRSLVTDAKKKDTTALIFALKNLCPARCSDRRHTGHTSSDRSMSPTPTFHPKSQEDLARLRAMYDEHMEMGCNEHAPSGWKARRPYRHRPGPFGRIAIGGRAPGA
jgi:hypothetical protein